MATRLNVRINRKRPESMTRQIREQINDLIEAGELAAGALLPSERELANSLKVARNVVRGAYEQLMDAGQLRSEGRKGRSVSSGRSSGGRSTTKKRSSGTKTSSPPISHRWRTPWRGCAALAAAPSRPKRSRTPTSPSTMRSSPPPAVAGCTVCSAPSAEMRMYLLQAHPPYDPGTYIEDTSCSSRPSSSEARRVPELMREHLIHSRAVILDGMAMDRN